MSERLATLKAELVIKRAKRLRSIYQADLGRFIAFLDRLQAQT
jgi:hypothetical protein